MGAGPPNFRLRPVPRPGASPAPPRAVEPDTLRGERVCLRPLLRADFALLGAWAEDPTLDALVGSELLRRCRAVRRYGLPPTEAFMDDPSQVVLIIVPAGAPEHPLGLARLFGIHLVERYAFLEVLLVDARARRKGLGVEAGRLICCYGADVLGLHRIEAKVYEGNRLSANCLRRNGFRLEGVLRQAGYHGGSRSDILVFGIVGDEIEAQRRRVGAPRLALGDAGP